MNENGKHTGKRRIYMAGKIAKGDWRTKYSGRGPNSEMMGQIIDAGAGYSRSFEWEPVPFGRHVYTGPFFVGCDHGCYHGSTQHGMGASSPCCNNPVMVPDDNFGDVCSNCGTPGMAGCYDSPVLRPHVQSACLLAIQRSDTFFAWIDSDYCYGTLVELGFARLLCRDIWVAGPEYKREMWFAYGMATDTTFNYDNPHDALSYFFKKHDGRLDYYEYIQSPEWREKAEAAKERAGQRCQVCNRSRDEVTLDAHHRTYERLGHEYESDITVLCRDCHALYEQNKRRNSR